MDRAPNEVVQPFPSSRCYHIRSVGYYYAYSHSPAIDCLHSVFHEKEPSILVLECGDIQFYFYTLWKNFSSYSVNVTGSHFTGVRFVLSDHSTAVLARNILLLYLALKTPSRIRAAKKWLCSMWAIWFCHELLPGHKHVLQKALASLLAMSENSASWTRESNILRNIVKFSSPATLNKIHGMWNMWLNDDFESVEEMKKSRMAMMSGESAPQHFFTNRESISKGLALSYFGSHLEADSLMCHGMQEEIMSYIEKGTMYAEAVLGLELDLVTAVNPTFYEDKKSYSLHYASIPFSCFFHTIEFSAKSGITKGLLLNRVAVEDNWFDSNRLLANSVQQFAVRVQAIQEVLHPVLDQPKPCFTLTMDCSNALQFCQQKQMEKSLGSEQVVDQFDVIHQMYFFDDTSVPAFVLSALHLLKQKGILFTTTYLYKSVAMTVDYYLEELFGFLLEMLPIVCGIHCIGHEGIYADNTAFQIFNPVGIVRCSNTVAWQRAGNVLLKMQYVSQCKAIVNALHLSILASTLPFFGIAGMDIRSLLCAETTIQVLLSFCAQLEQDVSVNDYNFWEDLCVLVKEECFLGPFLTHIQTQALMHKLHLHLTITEADCPLCNGQPVSSSIALYSVTCDIPPSVRGNVNPLVILVRRCPEKAFIRAVFTDGVPALENGDDVHIVDSFTYTETSDQIEMDFYFPRMFTKLGYYCSVCVMSDHDDQRPNLREVSTFKLGALEVHNRTYHFNEVSTSLSHPSSNFGCITEHLGDEDEFTSTILLYEGVADKLQQGGLEIRGISESVLKLKCGVYHMTIFYPCPVEGVAFFESRIMTVIAARDTYHFQNRRRLYSTNPDNLMSFPAVRLKLRICRFVSRLQFTNEDNEIRFEARFKRAPLTPEIKLKESLGTLFQSPFHQHFFAFRMTASQQVVCLVLHDSMVFDVQAKSPAIDIYFHFLHKRSRDLVLPGWQEAMIGFDAECKYIDILEEELALLRQYFFYFATLLKQKPSNQSVLLHKHGIGRYFSRAVIYPFYADFDRLYEEYANKAIQSEKKRKQEGHVHEKLCDIITSLSLNTRQTQQSCDFCHSQSSDLKKCSRCGKASYCNSDCQQKHWKTHHFFCQPATQEIPQQTASQNPVQLASPTPKQAADQETPKQSASQETPVQAASQEIPTQVASEEMPKQVASQETPVQAASQEIPTQVASQEMPKQVASQEIPTQVASQEMPKQVASQEMPKHVASQEIPKHVASRETPKQVTSQETPKHVTSQETPKHVASQETPKQSSQETLKQVTSQETPKQVSSEETPMACQGTPTPMLHQCAWCRRSDRRLKTCRRCQLIAYCSKKCREKHRTSHSAICKLSDTK